MLRRFCAVWVSVRGGGGICRGAARRSDRRRVWRRRAALLRRPSDRSARVELRCFTGNRGGPDDRGQNGVDRGNTEGDDGNFLRALAETVLQIIMDADVEALIGAGRHERSDGRLTYRNGYRDRTRETRLGGLTLRIPKLRHGS